MPFPTTAVLDSFNAGATQNLTARSGWSANVIDTTNPDASCVTDATPTLAKGGSAFIRSSNVWTLGAADAEAWATDASGAAGPGFGVWARLTNHGTTTPSGYLADYSTSTNTLDLFKVVAGVATLIASGFVSIIAAAESFGIEVIGTAITAYRKLAAGSWTVSCTVTDSSITGAGDIGVSLTDNTAAVDFFAGGAVVAAASYVVQMGRFGDRNDPVFV